MVRMKNFSLVVSSLLSGLIHILICNTKIGEKSDIAKS